MIWTIYGKSFLYIKNYSIIIEEGGNMDEKVILLKRIIGDLKKITGVIGGVVVSGDGAVIASDMGGGMNEEELGAITVFAASLGTQLDSEFKLGNFERVTIEGHDYKIISLSLGNVFVGIITQANVSMSMITAEIENAASKIKEVM